ncbi:MAG: phosphotransferase [Epsilonproteobacteria bacterium]|nr:phosphotransferase [Campylobacterota bacterium]
MHEIFEAFEIKEAKVEPIEIGIINQSFRLITPEESFFLQKINHHVFKDINGLMQNIELVTKHLANKFDKHCLKVPKIIPTIDKKLFFKDTLGDYWRVFELIEETHSFNYIVNEHIAFEAGKMLGKFIEGLSDFDSQKLVTTIPNFTNLQMRLNTFDDIVQKDNLNRLISIQKELDFIQKYTQEMVKFDNLLKSEAIPKRVTHNDTKINNFLFDNKDNAVALIDFDTLMQGSVLFDFGDAMRSGLNTSKEDESNLENITINMDIFKAYSQGFLSQVELTKEEKKNLINAILFVSFMLGIRFLSDYLDGDRYFHTQYPFQNLYRCRVQFKVFELIVKQEKEMENILKNLS